MTHPKHIGRFVVLAAAVGLITYGQMAINNSQAEVNQALVDSNNLLRAALVSQQAQIDSLKIMYADAGALTIYTYERQDKIVPLVFKNESETR